MYFYYFYCIIIAVGNSRVDIIIRRFYKKNSDRWLYLILFPKNKSENQNNVNQVGLLFEH